MAIAVAASLLVFPNALLWMIAFWLAAASAGAWRNRATWLPLAVGVTVLLVKRPDWSPGMTQLTTSVVLVAAILFWKRADGMAGRRRLVLVALGLMWVLWIVAVWESHSDSHSAAAVRLDPNRPIVCLGDSLTTGMADDEAYPVYLQQLVRVPVLNFGRAGIAARDALKQLPAIVATHPRVVVVELGGHDFLRGYGRAAARASLVEIIEACQGAGAAVILVEIPRGFIMDSFSGLERELARQYDLELVPDTAIRMLVLRSSTFPILGNMIEPRLSDDGLHPNVAGAKYLAHAVNSALANIMRSSTGNRETANR